MRTVVGQLNISIGAINHAIDEREEAPLNTVFSKKIIVELEHKTLQFEVLCFFLSPSCVIWNVSLNGNSPITPENKIVGWIIDRIKEES